MPDVLGTLFLEVSQKNFPLAFRYRDHWLNNLFIEAHWYAGKLWRPFYGVSGEYRKTPWTLAEYKDGEISPRGTFVVHDGLLWCETGEPRYVIHTLGNRDHEASFTTIGTDTYFNPMVSSERYFRADQLEAALVEHERVARARGDLTSLPGAKWIAKRRIEVLLPEAVRLQPHQNHVATVDEHVTA